MPSRNMLVYRMPPSPRTTKLERIFELCEEELYIVKTKTGPSLNLAITCFTPIQYCLFFWKKQDKQLPYRA